MQPAVVGHIDEFKTLHSSLLTNLGNLTKLITKGKLKDFDFTKTLAIIDLLREKNLKIKQTSDDVSSSLIRGQTAHWGSNVLKILLLIVIVGTVVYVFIIQKIYPDLPQISPDVVTGLFTLTSAPLLIRGEVKEHSDEQAKAVAVNPPKPENYFDHLKTIVEHAQAFLGNLGITPQEAFEGYQKIYPLLPSKYKKILPDTKNWSPKILSQIQMAMQGISKIASSSVPIADEDHDEHGNQVPQLIIEDNHTISSSSSQPSSSQASSSSQPSSLLPPISSQTSSSTGTPN